MFNQPLLLVNFDIIATIPRCGNFVFFFYLNLSSQPLQEKRLKPRGKKNIIFNVCFKINDRMYTTIYRAQVTIANELCESSSLRERESVEGMWCCSNY